uniref:Lipase n=1 Tax=Culicoides sonorensis TaxID=179676 RepID=A0A336MD17_CULSO
MLLQKIIYQIIFFDFVISFNVTFQYGDYILELIRNNGYLGYRHNIWTEDGYGLALYQIPSISESNTNVLLSHGLLSCSAQWLINGNKSLAFMLANAGYNVWLLNSRGTFLSDRHRFLSNEDPAYWDYSFHELGYYDISATIDYILDRTKSEKLHFIGYSQGGQIILNGVSLRPEYNQKVHSCFLINPGPFLSHMTFGLRKAFNSVVFVAKANHIFKLILKNSFLVNLIKFICHDPLISKVCHHLIMELHGGNSRQTRNTQSFMDILTTFIIDNVSVKQLEHVVQLIDSGNFETFDTRLERYGSKLYGANVSPVQYNLSAFLIPTTVFYGSIDGLTTPTDVRYLISRLRNIQNVFEIPWNHLDLFVGRNSDQWLHQRIINSLNKYGN